MKHQEVRTLSICSPDNLNQLKPLFVAEISSRSEAFSIYTQTVATYDDTKKEANNGAKGTPLG